MSSAEQQARAIERERDEIEPVLQALLLAAAGAWLDHLIDRPMYSEPPVRRRLYKSTERVLTRDVKAMAAVLWQELPGAGGSTSAPKTPRTVAAAVESVVEWGRLHAKTQLKRPGLAQPVLSPAGVELPPQRIDLHTPNDGDREWAEAAARTLSTQVSSELVDEVSRDLPAGLDGSRLKKAWITSADHRVRDSHRDLHGQTRDLGKSFKTFGRSRALAYPGDPRAPLGEVIGCRCTTVLVESEGASGLFGEFPLAAAATVKTHSVGELTLSRHLGRVRGPLSTPPFLSLGDSAFVALLPKRPELVALADSSPDDLDLDARRFLGPQELHVTLGYLGKNSDPEVTVEAYHAVDLFCRGAAHRYAELDAVVTGVEVFGHDGERAVVLTLDCPVAHQLRDELSQILDEHGSLTSKYTKYASYKPHLTLGYKVSEDDPQVHELVGRRIVLDRVVSTWRQMAPRHFQLRPR